MGIPTERCLFSDHTFFDFESRKRGEIESDLEQMSEDSLLLPEQNEMLNYLVDKYSIEEIYIDTNNIEKLHEEGKRVIVDYFGGQRYADTLTIYWKIPLDGDNGLLFFQPSSYRMYDGFRAAIDGNSLIISDFACITDIQKEPNIIEQKLNTKLQNFVWQIERLNEDIRRFNNSLKNFILNLIEQRRSKADIVKKALEVMNIPLQKNQDVPSVIPLKRTLVRPSMPTAKREKSYEILDEDYNHILSVIRHVGATFERARKTFCKLDEEELRDAILADLNGHYMGLATGETFRNNGKTDINIEFENRAAFVGECKIWKGEKIFHETLDQLVGYLTWRDNKNAMIFFNKKNKGFKAIQEKISESISKLEGCTVLSARDGEWEFKLSTTDYDKTVHVFLFDVYED